MLWACDGGVKDAKLTPARWNDKYRTAKTFRQLLKSTDRCVVHTTGCAVSWAGVFQSFEIPKEDGWWLRPRGFTYFMIHEEKFWCNLNRELSLFTKMQKVTWEWQVKGKQIHRNIQQKQTPICYYFVKNWISARGQHGWSAQQRAMSCSVVYSGFPFRILRSGWL